MWWLTQQPISLEAEKGQSQGRKHQPDTDIVTSIPPKGIYRMIYKTCTKWSTTSTQLVKT